MTISFNYLKSLFDDRYWDLGVLTPELFHRANLHPIKTKFHFSSDFQEDYANYIHLRKETNTLVLIRSGDAWDYTHYQEALDILQDNNVKEKCDYYMVYTNFKEAAILAGLGVRAKNSLIYTYKFGFDCHIAAIRFVDEITDLPTDKRINYKIWNRCVGCDDCAKACPVGAIHNSSKNQFDWWLDSSKCDDFIGYSDHPTIPSIKSFWYKNVHPELPEEQVKNNTTFYDAVRPFNEGGLNSLSWDANGYSYNGMSIHKDGNVVTPPVCRECTSQPRCSKWNGKYPYSKD